MQVTQHGLDVLLMAELMRLQRDHSRLEHLYEQLPKTPSHPNVEEKFLTLWSVVEKRADRLEFILDHLA